MPRISTDNYDTVASWNGSQDLFVVEQPDGTKVATPEQVKQYVLGDMDEVPTQNSDNPVKSGGIFSTMGVPRVDTANRRMYLEGGAAFDGNIDSFPTAGSNNAVSSGGTKTYVDNAVSNKAKTLLISNTSFSLDSNLAVGETANVIVEDSSLCIAFAGDSNSLSGTVARLANAVYAWHLATYNYKFIYVRTNSSFTVSRRFYAAGTSF